MEACYKDFVCVENAQVNNDLLFIESRIVFVFIFTFYCIILYYLIIFMYTLMISILLCDLLQIGNVKVEPEKSWMAEQKITLN